MTKMIKKALVITMVFSLAMSQLSISALADTEDGVIHEHNSVTCTVCNGKGTTSSYEVCPTCGGKAEAEVKTEPCSECDGDGWVAAGFDWDKPCPICNEAGCSNNKECIMGYQVIKADCAACRGTGKVAATSEGEEPCITCGGSGKAEASVTCAACDGKGTIPCDGDFVSSGLSSVSENGEGNILYTCKSCDASYVEALDAEATQQEIRGNINVTASVDKSSIKVSDKETLLSYQIKVTNNNKKIAFDAVNLQIQMTEGLTFKKMTGSAAGLDYNDENGILNITFKNLGWTSKTIKFTAAAEAGISAGSEAKAEVTGSVTVGGNTYELPKAHASTFVSKYGTTKSIILAGYHMGKYFDAPSPGIKTDTVRNTATLDQLEGRKFSFTEDFARGKETGFRAEPGVDENGNVENPYSGRTWKLVGFVPYAGYSGYSDEKILRSYVYNEKGENGFTEGTLKDAESFILEKNGVLYGEAASDHNLKAMAAAAGKSGNNAILMSVWYLAKEPELERLNYEENSLSLVLPKGKTPVYKALSEGVSIETGNVTASDVDGNHYFDVDLTVHISKDAPDELNINFTDALKECFYNISNLDYNSVQPGDTMRYKLHLENESGKEYKYVEGSAAIGTLEKTIGENENSMGTGFDGYPILMKGEFSPVPRRTLNMALKSLGITQKQLGDDKRIGKLLLETYGYGEKKSAEGKNAESVVYTDDDYEKITQNYLDDYYLDYLNRYREAGNKAASFHDITANEFARLTSDLNEKGAEETCQAAAEALYYFTYGKNYLFDGAGLYDRMAQNGEKKDGRAYYAEEKLAGLLEQDTVISSKVAGFTADNGAQRTYLGFSMQFALKADSTKPEQTVTGSKPSGDTNNDSKTTAGSKPPTITPEEPGVIIPEDPTPLDPAPENPVETVNIIDENVPQAGLPVINLADSAVPKTDGPSNTTVQQTKVPKTGDKQAAMPWTIAAALSAIALFSLCISDFKKKKA